jgi:hypothetical protein
MSNPYLILEIITLPDQVSRLNLSISGSYPAEIAIPGLNFLELVLGPVRHKRKILSDTIKGGLDMTMVDKRGLTITMGPGILVSVSRRYLALL